MAISLIEISVSGLVAFITWRLLRVLFRTSSFKNIPGPPANSVLSGHYGQIYNNDAWDFHRKLWGEYGSVVKLKGVLGKEFLYTYDPLVLHHILVKDHESFDEYEAFYVTNEMIIGKSLLSVSGDAHKRQRKMLNPVFSMRHMRDVLPVLYPIAHQLRESIKAEIHEGKEFIDVMQWMTRAALEYIGQGGLGYSFSSFDKDRKGDTYGAAIKKLMPLMFRTAVIRDLLPLARKLGPPKFRRFLANISPFSLPKDFLNVTDTLEEASKMVLSKKREALEKGEDAINELAGKGKDIISVLLKANMNEDISEEELVGHMITFIFAATDTTTGALSRIIHLLSLHPEVQDRLREEVITARKEHGDLDYDSLQALPFLDAVCRETMRVYPPAVQITRQAIKDVVVPLLYPIKAANGKAEIKEISVPKGTEFYISILGANRCKETWGEDAEEWKPSRWLNPLPESVVKAHQPGVYSQMMSFGGGGRACIGFKFSEMEMKMVLSVLVESFIFEPGKEVAWDMKFIAVPREVGTTDDKPRLPLKVKVVP